MDIKFKLLNLSPEMNFRLIRFHRKANVKKIKKMSNKVGSRDKSIVKTTFNLL